MVDLNPAVPKAILEPSVGNNFASSSVESAATRSLTYFAVMGLGSLVAHSFARSIAEAVVPSVMVNDVVVPSFSLARSFFLAFFSSFWEHCTQLHYFFAILESWMIFW